jgi:hypothetical protein
MQKKHYESNLTANSNGLVVTLKIPRSGTASKFILSAPIIDDEQRGIPPTPRPSQKNEPSKKAAQAPS